MENLLTTRIRKITFVALGDPFPGLKKLSACVDTWKRKKSSKRSLALSQSA